MTETTTSTTFKTPLAATKAWAKANDYEGRPGGWIYNAKGRPVIQGWAGLTGILVRHHVLRDLDGSTMATVSGTTRRNVFDGGPVAVDLGRGI